jgi:hypothetical protein
MTQHVTEQLSPYQHGELAADEAQHVAAHLSQCATCQAEYEAIQFGATMAARLNPAEAPASLWQDIQRQLAAPEPKRFWQFTPRMAFASAALALVLSVGSFWLYQRLTRPWWEVSALAGTPRVGTRAISQDGRLGVGDWLQTDAEARALIQVGEIGFVQVEPNTEMQLVTARAAEHRLAIKRGKMHAFITAPPKLFYVNTPTATAVDLGCAYSLEVDDGGQSVLRVISGWVAFELNGIESFVPATAMCITRPVLGPGTPYFESASATFQTALAQFDTTAHDATVRADALSAVLAEARERDALTLWHLLTRTRGDERGRVYDRFAELITTPPHVTREGILDGNRMMLDTLWNLLNLDSASWWRIWKGPVPSAGN